MSTERQKMLAGEMYDPLDPELLAARVRARDLCQHLNATRESEEADCSGRVPGADRRLHDVRAVGAALHPLHPFNAERRRREEFGKPIEIGSDVWVGGGAIILAGVRIGSRVVIGAGSVVTRDVPDAVFAAGNPCRVIRAITE